MKTITRTVFPWLGRHWLRLGVLAIFLFVISRKQIDLSIQFGRPAAAPVREADPPTPGVRNTAETRTQVFTQTESPASNVSEPGGWLQKMNILGGSSSGALLNRLRATDAGRVDGFVRRFSHVAEKESAKFGVPASIILANALLQSGAGTTAAASAGDNLFNLPCTADWQGPVANTETGCFRKYENAWTSFRDHSLYLTTGAYAGLTQIPAGDYAAWANGLERLRYGGQDDLAEQLISTIEHWQLQRFDS